MRSPAGLLTALVLAVVFLLVWLLSMERSREEQTNPEAGRVLAGAVEALRLLPDGSPLLAVPDGEPVAERTGEPGTSPDAPASGWLVDWRIQPFRWQRSRFVPAPGGTAHELLKVTVRVRRRGKDGALAAGPPLSTATFVRAELRTARTR